MKVKTVTTEDKILLLSDNSKIKSIKDYSQNIVPEMNSEIQDGFKVSSSVNSINSYNVFREAGNWRGRSRRDWVQISLDKPRVVSAINLSSTRVTTFSKLGHYYYGLTGFEIWGGDSEDNLKKIFSSKHPQVEGLVFYPIENKDAYKIYRIVVTDYYTNASHRANNPLIKKMELIENTIAIRESLTYSENSSGNRGMSPQELSDLDFSSEFTGKHYIQDVSTVLGSGKVFEQDLDVDKVIKKLTIKWEFYESTIDNKILILNDGSYKKWDGSWQIVITSTPTEQDYINNGVGISDIEAIPESAWAELQALGEIKILYYTNSSSTEEITIETETEPYTIYDEFGDSMEVLYYTDDPDKEDAELHITANYSPLDEFDDFSVVTWTDDTENLSLKIDFEKEPKQICVQTDTLSISSLTTSIVYTGSSDIRVLISFDNGLIYRHPVTFEEVTVPDYIDSEKEPINITQYKQEEINTLYNQAGALTDLNTSDFLEKAIQEGSFKGLFILGKEDAFLDKIEITTASEVKSSPTVRLYEMEYYVVKE